MASKPPAPSHKIGRDAGTGKFKPVEQARRDKAGSVVETIPSRSPAPPPKKR